MHNWNDMSFPNTITFEDKNLKGADRAFNRKNHNLGCIKMSNNN